MTKMAYFTVVTNIACRFIIEQTNMKHYELDTLKFYKQFPSEIACIEYLEALRWGSRPLCPYCQSVKTSSIKQEYRHHCNNCSTSFSVTVNTLFHRSHIPLQKWFLAIYVLLSTRAVISIRQLAMLLEINKNTASKLDLKIRNALFDPEHRNMLEKIQEKAREK